MAHTGSYISSAAIQHFLNSQSFRAFTKLVQALREQAAPASATWERAMNAVVKQSAVALTLTAALALPALSAHADRIEGVTVSSAPTIRVSYAELDINKPRGLQALYSRIQNAAEIVCGVDHTRQSLASGRHAAACYKTAVDDAVRQINRPTLTALHRTKTRSSLS